MGISKLKWKRDVALVLLPAVVMASCATMPEEEKQADKQLISRTLKKAKEAQERVRSQKETNLVLKKPIPVKTLIQGICKDKHLACDVSSVGKGIYFTNNRFKGDYDDLIGFLSSKYGIKVEKVGDTFFFSSTPKANLTKLNAVVPINVVKEPLGYFLSLLSDKAGIPFKLEDVDTNAKVSYFSTDKTLKQILDEITSQFDLYWTYANGAIKISRYQRATFRVLSPFLQKSIDINGSGGEYKIKYDRNFLKNLEANLKKVLEDKNSEVSVTQTGYVLVNARPSEVEQIRNFIRKINVEFTKVIPLRLTIAVINLNDKSSAGIDLMKINNLEQLPHYIQGTVQGKITPDAGITLGITGSDINTVIKAFNSFGNVRITENNVFRVLNGQPLVYNPTKNQRIISNFKLTYVPVGGGATGTTATSTQPTLTTETENIKEGSNLLIVPYYIGNHKIVVDMYRSQNQIESLTPFTINLSGYQNQLILPTTDKSTSIQQAVLKKGESIVMLSSVIDTKEFRNKGAPKLKDIPFAGLLAGSSEKVTGRAQYLIIVSYGI